MKNMQVPEQHIENGTIYKGIYNTQTHWLASIDPLLSPGICSGGVSDSSEPEGRAQGPPGTVIFGKERGTEDIFIVFQNICKNDQSQYENDHVNFRFWMYGYLYILCS